MKKSKRYIKKQNNKPLINKKVLAKVIRESNICKHAIKELKLAGYGNGEGGPNDWVDILINVIYYYMKLIKDGLLVLQ